VVDLVFQQHEVSYNVCLEAGGWEVIKRYVQIGLGVSIVTSICLRDEEPLWRCSLAEYFPKRSYGVVLRRGRFLSPQAQRFLELLDEDGFEHEPSNGKPAAQAEHPPSGDPA
jgi:DNA-binding transcriptional LysR family regulator